MKQFIITLLIVAGVMFAADVPIRQTTGDFQGTAVSGDITITAGGVTAIGSGKVTNAMLATSALAVATKETATSYTVGTTDPKELYGGVIYVNGAATITAPATAAGASFTVITIGAVAVSVDVNGADTTYLNGTALSAGDKITNTSTTGDMAVFTYKPTGGWYATAPGWTDGN